jgi:hypothetical protein
VGDDFIGDPILIQKGFECTRNGHRYHLLSLWEWIT